MELLQRLERNWKQFEITTTDCDSLCRQGHEDQRSPLQRGWSFITKWEKKSIYQRHLIQYKVSSCNLLISLHLGFFLFFPPFLSFPIFSLIIDHQSSKHLWKDFFAKFGVKLSWRFRLLVQCMGNRRILIFYHIFFKDVILFLWSC